MSAASPNPSDPVDATTLDAVVARLCSTSDHLTHTRSANGGDHKLPSRDAIVEMVEGLRAVLFPGYFGTSELSPESLRFHVGATLDRVLRVLREQVERCLLFTSDAKPLDDEARAERASEVTREFLKRLPEVRRLLATDVKAAYEGDPAAPSPDETIFCYPGILAVANYRLAHELYRLGIPLLPRMITEHAHSITGIDIHPGAQIGPEFFIDHGTGVVIGETCVIGTRVRVYQGVTLGAKSFPLDEKGNPIKGIPRHPIVEDDVIIYGGATILGRVTIGRGSTIGGNVWLTHSVPPGSRVSQAQTQLNEFRAGAGI
ncbi:MAG: serine acetyltransferase [Candidatus Zixiibacteriota bacterium]